MRDPVEIYGVPFSRSTPSHGPPRPAGFSTQHALADLATDGEQVMKRSLLIGGSIVLGALAWSSSARASTGSGIVDGTLGAHPP